MRDAKTTFQLLNDNKVSTGRAKWLFSKVFFATRTLKKIIAISLQWTAQTLACILIELNDALGSFSA